MIIEGVVTTIDAHGRVNVAPMGPLTDPELGRFTFRPFQSSRTYRNLLAHPEGVFHVTDDVELLARACVGDVEAPMRDAERVRGRILTGACRYYEFRVTKLDDREPRTRIEVEVLASGRIRDFFGFNRAKHAVVEAAIAASRIGILPATEIRDEFRRLELLVDKTAGESERKAFRFLEKHMQSRLAEIEDGPIRIETGSRLHFGLLSPWSGTGRRHGGLGLMVTEPGVRLTLSRAERTSVEGALVERSSRILDSVLKAAGAQDVPVRLHVERAPPEHIGLGTGTQLSLAIARALAEHLHDELPLDRLARWTGRGHRSAVGIRGFEAGGFIVDGGHAAENTNAEGAVAPLLSRLQMPEDWRVVLAWPRQSAGLSGDAERVAFRELVRDDSELVAQQDRCAILCRDVLLRVLPALAEGDFDNFVRAIWDVQVSVGEMFSTVQGGRFRGSGTAKIVNFLREEGVEGTGQSSWGPSVFAFFRDEKSAEDIRDRLCGRFDLDDERCFVTRALNRGASVARVASPDGS